MHCSNESLAHKRISSYTTISLQSLEVIARSVIGRPRFCLDESSMTSAQVEANPEFHRGGDRQLWTAALKPELHINTTLSYTQIWIQHARSRCVRVFLNAQPCESIAASTSQQWTKHSGERTGHFVEEKLRCQRYPAKSKRSGQSTMEEKWNQCRGGTG